MKICIACGMPMNKAEDFAMGDQNKDYCLYCCNPDGSMHSYEQKLEGMTAFIVKTQGLDEKTARSAAQSMMANLPAWKDQSKAAE
jgi:hypothetical protein